MKNKKIFLILFASLTAIALMVNFNSIKYYINKMFTDPPVVETGIDVTDINCIIPESVIEYTQLNSRVEAQPSKKLYLYDFNSVKEHGFGADGSERYTEMYYGLTAMLENGKIRIKTYDNRYIDNMTIGSCKLEALDLENTFSRDVKINGTYSEFDITDLSNGLYRFAVELFPGVGETAVSYIYFYINDDGAWLCSAEFAEPEFIDSYINHRKAFARYLELFGTTPEGSLDEYEIHYPVCFPDDTVNYRCDTQRWIDMANTLVKEEDSDAKKVFIFHEWMVENLAYDTYAADFPETRMKLNEDYSGKWSIYDIRVGFCHDFVNILAIMCRSQGIPAICVNRSTTNHTWSAVYVDNRWVELDITWDIEREVLTEDITDIKNNDVIHNYKSYFTLQPNYDWSTFVPSDVFINDSLMLEQNVLI